MPLSSTLKTSLEEVARPVWVLGENGEPVGMTGNPIHVIGTVELVTGIDPETGESVLLVDTLSGAQVGIDLHHYRIHSGHDFFTSYKTPDASALADNASLSFGVTTGGARIHLVARGAIGGDFEGLLYEGSVWTGGTGQDIFNKRRDSLITTTASVVRDPTVSNVGTLLENEFIPGGIGPQAVGGSAGQDMEWILAPNRKYLVRITNRAGNAQPASLALEWYEEG